MSNYMDLTWQQILLLGVLTTPLATVGIVAIIRGYHMDLKIWRGRQKERDDNGDN